jgi:hypothetical protein
MPTTTSTPNLATCVKHVQFNTGDGLHQRELLEEVKGGKCVTLTADRELRGSLLVVLDPFVMSNLRVSKTNLQLFLLDGDGRREFGEVADYSKNRFHGFLTPELSLVFGELRVLSLVYDTVSGAAEVLRVTVACTRPSLSDLD